MKPDNLAVSILIALGVGVVQLVILGFAWSYIATYSPLPQWLISNGILGATLYVIVFISDSIFNVALCLPAAYVLCRLRPRNITLYLLLAVLPGFVWQYRLVFTDPSAFSQVSLFVPGALSALLMLPAAVFIVHILLRRRNV
jgi:hypothetical protein